MKTLETLGKPTPFTYTGSVKDGVVIHHETLSIPVDPTVFSAALKHFAGREIKGGFNLTNTPSDGFGSWLISASLTLNRILLQAKNASHVAAILCSEAGVNHFKRGNAVWLRFPK